MKNISEKDGILYESNELTEVIATKGNEPPEIIYSIKGFAKIQEIVEKTKEYCKEMPYDKVWMRTIDRHNQENEYLIK